MSESLNLFYNKELVGVLIEDDEENGNEDDTDYKKQYAKV